MAVRQRSERDLVACVEVLARVHEQDGYPTRWPSDAYGWLVPAGLVESWVADLNGGVCGHIALVRGADDVQLREAVDTSNNELMAISRLFVDPAVRGKGMGELLLRTATSYAVGRRWGLMLDVVDDRRSAAIALYERLGWRMVGRREADWVTPEGVRPRLRLYVLPATA
jgi:GNAT superfamily N-acetyltransferase